jgi:hypothetical protein
VYHVGSSEASSSGLRSRNDPRAPCRLEELASAEKSGHFGRKSDGNCQRGALRRARSARTPSRQVQARQHSYGVALGVGGGIGQAPQTLLPTIVPPWAVHVFPCRDTLGPLAVIQSVAVTQVRVALLLHTPALHVPLVS